MFEINKQMNLVSYKIVVFFVPHKQFHLQPTVQQNPRVNAFIILSFTTSLRFSVHTLTYIPAVPKPCWITCYTIKEALQ